MAHCLPYTPPNKQQSTVIQVNCDCYYTEPTKVVHANNLECRLKTFLYYVDECGQTMDAGTIDHSAPLEKGQVVNGRDGQYKITDVRYTGLSQAQGITYQSYCAMVVPYCSPKPMVGKVICLPSHNSNPCVPKCPPAPCKPSIPCPPVVKTVRVIEHAECKPQAPLGNSVPQYIEVKSVKPTTYHYYSCGCNH